ncbi:MAG: tetraacyldisaccharide 4'-kinase [Flavobacteriaceae bacterium]|nr:tetraacyldisaccharide 4'-kinase [Flavobacteriaceae bacterium]|tara:strand:- start:375 stop:1400 length:1026 start_codon:yes stop_codon:yes gene_type:complete
MKNLRFLLLPFALLYGLIIFTRNLFFNIGVFSSKKFDILSIGVGNLSMGGTGKSILVEYLISCLKDKYKLATLSRGYGRSSKGFIIAEKNSLPTEVGDEPFQFLNNHPEIKVTVCENRRIGVEKIKTKLPEINLIIFDDLMQHRWVKSDFLIATTSFHKPFFNDYLFPVGMLREQKQEIKRADVILITSTPQKIKYDEKNNFLNKIKIFYTGKVFFTRLRYSNNLFNLNHKISDKTLAEKSFILVTGIADSKGIVEYLKLNNYSFEHLKYSDHHNYSKNDCELINKKGKDKIILTTEKDFGKLSIKLKSLKLYYIKVYLDFLNENEAKTFSNLVKTRLSSI